MTFSSSSFSFLAFQQVLPQLVLPQLVLPQLALLLELVLPQVLVLLNRIRLHQALTVVVDAVADRIGRMDYNLRKLCHNWVNNHDRLVKLLSTNIVVHHTEDYNNSLA